MRPTIRPAETPMNPTSAWGSLALGLLLILFYEVHAHRVSKRDPTHQARFINSHMRMAWVQAMSVSYTHLTLPTILLV